MSTRSVGGLSWGKVRELYSRIRGEDARRAARRVAVVGPAVDPSLRRELLRQARADAEHERTLKARADAIRRDLYGR